MLSSACEVHYDRVRRLDDSERSNRRRLYTTFIYLGQLLCALRAHVEVDGDDIWHCYDVKETRNEWLCLSSGDVCLMRRFRFAQDLWFTGAMNAWRKGPGSGFMRIPIEYARFAIAGRLIWPKNVRSGWAFNYDVLCAMTAEGPARWSSAPLMDLSDLLSRSFVVGFRWGWD